MFAFSILLLLPTMIVSEVLENFNCHMIDVPVAIIGGPARTLKFGSGEHYPDTPITENWKDSKRFANKVVYRKGDDIFSHDDETGITSFAGNFWSNNVNTATRQEAVALFKTSKDPDDFERKAKGKVAAGQFQIRGRRLMTGSIFRIQFLSSGNQPINPTRKSTFTFDLETYLVQSPFLKEMENVFFFFTNKTDLNMVRIDKTTMIVYNFQTKTTTSIRFVKMHLEGLMLPCQGFVRETPITCGSGNVKHPPISMSVLVAVMTVLFANT